MCRLKWCARCHDQPPNPHGEADWQPNWEREPCKRQPKPDNEKKKLCDTLPNLPDDQCSEAWNEEIGDDR
jgi:hypothetical protein